MAKSIKDIVDVSKSIDGHSFTIGWLLDSLRNNDKAYQKLHGDRAVKAVVAKDISDGKGFASHVLRCVITFVDSVDNSDSYSTILKIPFFNTFNKNQVKQKFIDLHNFECDFYATLESIIEAPTPKVHSTVRWLSDDEKSEGCVHMEDMSGKGKTISYFESLNLGQVKYVIKTLAKMHKRILCADECVWRGKYLKNQESFVDFLDMFDPIIEPFLKKCKVESESFWEHFR